MNISLSSPLKIFFSKLFQYLNKFFFTRLDVIIHDHKGDTGTSTPLNAHFKFSIHTAFSKYLEVDKIIILEDDLVVSPDFIRSGKWMSGS